MGVEEPKNQRFRPKGTQELVAQAISTNPSNEGLKGKVNKLKELASEAKKNWRLGKLRGRNKSIK